MHRPRYDDWSLPKGKVEPGETDEDAARREVEEETGYRCTLGDELTTVRYIDRKGRNKQVRFWKMTVSGEVDLGPRTTRSTSAVGYRRRLPRHCSPTKPIANSCAASEVTSGP